MREVALLTGKLEATNEPYAIAKSPAKSMGLPLYNRQFGTENRVMPTNLYNLGDNYHLLKKT